MTYTTILHEVMKEFKLTVTEYAIMDTVYRLSVNPKSKMPGWCYARRDWLGKLFGIGRSTVFVILDRLEEKQLLIRNSRGCLQATKKWVDVVELSLEEEHRDSPESGLKGAKSGLHTIQKSDSQSPEFGHYNTKDSKKDILESGNSHPFGEFDKKGETTAAKLVRKLHKLTGKGVLNMKREASIVINLMKKGYSKEELGGAIEWGVKDRDMMYMKQLPDVVNWYLTALGRDARKKKQELEELDPIERGVLEDMGEL